MSHDEDPRLKRFAKSQAPRLASIIRDLEKRLLDELILRNGPIGEKEIKFLCQESARDYDRLSSVLYKTLKRLNSWDDDNDFSHRRQNILGRLLVSRFENQIEGRSEMGIYGGALPRFAVTGILDAFKGLIGSEIFDELRHEVTHIHAAILENNEDSEAGAVWEEFYNNQQSIICVLRMVSRLAQRFQKYDKRKKWMIDYINVNVSPSEDDTDPSHTNWKFSNMHFTSVMNAFVQDARNMMGNTKSYAKLQNHFSEEEITGIGSFIDKLSAEVTAKH
ncbi:MAG: hypothetical protein HOI23_17935 [Deltaproteobacteria bacterium]|jgi:hypothetical protein|nr:hypothetical protein [Deltaproteobacteria bacterium]MBT6491892.1 hypothetical protein [Deltaproteobacteria bacterium]